MDDTEHQLDSQAFELRSFGRQRGRKPSPRQAQLFEHLLPQLAVDLSAPFNASLFAPSGRLPERESEGAIERAPEGAKQLWLEIGFGGAEHLIWQAKNNPGVSLIGCEPFIDGVVKALSAIDEHALTNVRLHADDARPLLRWLAPASLDRAFILFPDPWPKKKHVKRRLVGKPLLDLLARAMKPGAELRIGTDIGDYARTLLLAFEATPAFRWMATSPQDWRQRPADWPPTRYEAKAIREGRQRYFLTFVRQN